MKRLKKILRRIKRKSWPAILILILAVIVSTAAVVYAQTIPSDGISNPHPSSSHASIRIDIEENKVQPVAAAEIRDDTNPDITEEDIDLLARLITAEQGYATSYGGATGSRIIEDYYLTGSVVLNRMNSQEFPDTLRDVIYQCGQYDVVNNGAIERDYDDIAWEVAEELLTYGTDIPDNVVFQAEFTQGSGVYKQSGRTYYCYR